MKFRYNMKAPCKANIMEYPIPFLVGWTRCCFEAFGRADLKNKLYHSQLSSEYNINSNNAQVIIPHGRSRGSTTWSASGGHFRSDTIEHQGFREGRHMAAPWININTWPPVCLVQADPPAFVALYRVPFLHPFVQHRAWLRGLSRYLHRSHKPSDKSSRVYSLVALYRLEGPTLAAHLQLYQENILLTW